MFNQPIREPKICHNDIVTITDQKIQIFKHVYSNLLMIQRIWYDFIIMTQGHTCHRAVGLRKSIIWYWVMRNCAGFPSIEEMHC